MMNYLHRIVGIFPSREAAERAQGQIVAHDIAPHQVRVLVPGAASLGSDAKSDSDDVLKDLFRDGAIGAAVGTAAGAGATLALAVANVSLFVASPVVAALSMLGWGASLGGVVGAVVGAERSKGDVSHLIEDALGEGHSVLVVHAGSEEQTSLVRGLLGESMNDAGIGVLSAR